MRSTRRKSAFGLFQTVLIFVGLQAGVAALANEENSSSADSTVQPAGQTTNEPAALEEVIVTARKRDERLLDIPESITVISSSDLANKGIETIEDVGRQTSNLQLNMRQDLTTNVVIRGVGAYGDVLGVGFSIDNVPNFTDQTMRLEDLESVEVLKGPQGTLYGGSSIGGLIRYVSKKPSFDWSGETSAEVGSFNQMNVFAAQNFVIIPDQLALRLSGYDAKSAGWITNDALGIDGNPSTDYGIRAMLLYRPNDAWSALLTLRHSYIRNGADEYAPVTGVMGYTYDAPFFQPTFNTRTTDGAVLELNGDLGPVQLTSISSDTYALYAQSADISFTPPNVPGQSLITMPGNRPTRVDTQEFRVTSPSGHPFQWLAGIYAANIEDVLLNQNAVANYPPPPETTVVNDFQTKRTDEAIFGNASYSYGPLSLEAGLRITETQFKANVFVEAGGLPDQSGSVTSRAALPKVSLSYGLPSDERVYVTVAKGMEPGAVNTVSTAPIPYRSETAVSYELGTKGTTLEHRLEYDLAVFYINNDNHQYETNQYIASEGGLVTLIDNIGNSRNYGAETSATWRATQEVTLGANGGYLNAKWKTAAVFGESIDGNTIPNAPEVTASVNAAYSRAVLGNLRFDGNFDMSYTDAMWWDLPNTPTSKEHPHWLGSLRAALGTDGRGWQVAFRVENILGAKYWTEYFPNFFPAGSYPCTGCSNIGAIGAPRAFIMSAAFRY